LRQISLYCTIEQKRRISKRALYREIESGRASEVTHLIFDGKLCIILEKFNKKGRTEMILGFIQNMGPWQIVICVVVAFVLFGGAKKIPELAKSLGRAKNEFKKGLAEGEKEMAAEEAAEKKAEAAKEIA
jgi:sec-independent protein translocase protein TatA